MDDLGRAFEQIRTVRDGPVVHRLLLDCYALAREHGESEGLRYAAMYLNGMKAYGRHESALRAFSDGLAGAVLGVRPFPVSGEWWGLLEDGDVVPADDRRAGRAVYWCVSPAGWYRVPCAAGVNRAAA